MWYCFVWTLFGISLAGTRKTPMRVVVSRMGDCDQMSNMSVFYSEFSVSIPRAHARLNVSGTVTISTGLPNGWTIKVHIFKCQDMRYIGSCDLLNKFVLVQTGCEDNFLDKGYGQFFKSTIPRLSCPLRYGRYHIRNYEWSVDYFSSLERNVSPGLLGYNVNVETYSEGAMVSCLNMKMPLYYVQSTSDPVTLSGSSIRSSSTAL